MVLGSSLQGAQTVTEGMTASRDCSGVVPHCKKDGSVVTRGDRGLRCQGLKAPPRFRVQHGRGCSAPEALALSGEDTPPVPSLLLLAVAASSCTSGYSLHLESDQKK